ncbi:hypothetical protein DPMN_178835 [Dreissena polymorpha]|uniref:Uncharacterized protein n=1 Tax=Dreissena polymorpha TaxID=45954 RepID=A0A9D4IMZ3_DREPO|nr:hypothetical protein DPMN_178835 [Dreissena polymorpha]
MILIPRVILPQSQQLQELYRTLPPNLPETHHPRAPTLQDQHRSLTPNFTNFIVCRHPVCRSSIVQYHPVYKTYINR